MPDEEEQIIPDSVLQDFNERTIKRFLRDPQFRRALLSDPSECNRAEGLGLSDDTINWINERVRLYGLRRLLADVPGEFVPM